MNALVAPACKVVAAARPSAPGTPPREFNSRGATRAGVDTTLPRLAFRAVDARDTILHA